MERQRVENLSQVREINLSTICKGDANKEKNNARKEMIKCTPRIK